MDQAILTIQDFHIADVQSIEFGGLFFRLNDGQAGTEFSDLLGEQFHISAGGQGNDIEGTRIGNHNFQCRPAY
jgi:hypothetical protein